MSKKITKEEKMVLLNLLGVQDWIVNNATSDRLGLLGSMLTILLKSFGDEKEVLLFEHLKRYQAGMDPEFAAMEQALVDNALAHNLEALSSEQELFSTLGIEVK